MIAHSVRLTAGEMRSDTMWRWWLKRTDLMVRRMNLGFGHFGLRDMGVANDEGLLDLPGGSVAFSWNALIWLLAGTITDIVEGISPPEAEIEMTEAILRVFGVDASAAARAARSELPDHPEIELDFHFRLDAG